ncbi:sugar phosphate isomerase/epimerase family protein [Phycisphaerales bacterium AB-hyl4]|uniref:Sugar phosphate isomerase/epimerase family protein n=1 Tax=Natronomicrosphaera hydrolytica TaxID=3242702 RepID=A0ABV4U532_9BACT
MQIGVSSYSFSRLTRTGEMSAEDVIVKTKEMGFDVLEFSTIPLPEGESLPKYAEKLRAKAESVGLPIVNYTIGADLINGSDGDLNAEVERVKRQVDVAQILGVKGMRHDATRGFTPEHKGPKSFDAALPRLVEGCRAITEYAADLGIRTMVENHGFFCQDSDRVEKLVCTVDHPNFGILADVGNFICVDENPGTALGRVMPHTFHVHFKDFHLKPGTSFPPGEGWNLSRGGNFWRGSIIGHGDVPLLQCVQVLKRNNYDGVVSIEFEGMEDTIRGIQIGQDNLRRLLGA